MKNKKVLVLSVAVLMAVAFGVAIKVFKSKEQARIGFLAQSNFSTFVSDHSPKMGSLQPKIFLVEFMDPECESCRMFHPLLKQLMQDYDGKIQLTVRYAPFHGNSLFAVKILEAARKQGKFWQTLDVLFQYQPQWGSHHNPQPDLIWNYLPEVGVDLDKIKADMNDPEIEKNINRDIEDGKILGVQRTPQFFVNGKPLERFGYEYLKEDIEKALQE
jgi:protein-disulfide isomerase